MGLTTAELAEVVAEGASTAEAAGGRHGSGDGGGRSGCGRRCVG
jgi:hypothetical protein